MAAASWAGLCLAMAAALPAAAQVPLPPGLGAPTGGLDAAPLGESTGALGMPPVRLGGFGYPFGGAPPPASMAGQGWSISPSLGVQVLATDNLFQTPQRQRSDFVTSISPGLLATADTARLRGTINYAPVAQFYASNSDQDRFNHRFNGQALATLVPQTLYFDLRGAAAVQATGGGFAPESSPVVDRRNQVQTTSFQASPYVVHRFGGLATAQLGYAFQHVSQDGNTSTLAGTGQPFFTRQEFTAHEGYGVLRSGENFGPLALEARVSGTAYTGTGVLDGAHRSIGTVEARYAILRGIAALVEGGYENQRYAGLPPVHISEPVWAVGARLTPGPDSVIIAKYGHRDGFNSFFLDAAVALGSRTRLFANYSERLTTSARRAADLLSTTSVDALGNPVDTLTGAPVVLPFSNPFLAVQSSLMRIRSASASVSQSWPRDTLTLSFFFEERRPISVAPGTVAFAQRGTSGSLSWMHDLTPRTSAGGYAQYGRFDVPAQGGGDVFTLSAVLTQRFTPGLTGTLQYSLTNRGSDLTTGRAVQNIILAGLRQVF